MNKNPNVVLIISDQWSTRIVDGSGDYDTGVQTPAIDRLAAEGMRFTQSYTSFPLCCPARASLFTGLMPHKHRIIDNEETYMYHCGAYPTRSDVVTMGAAFKAAGYKTAYFGKEHAGDYGWDGIDEFGSMKYSAGGMLAEGSAYDQIFTRDAIDYLRGNHDTPFYMVLSLINPHDICKVLGGKVKAATFADAIFFCRDRCRTPMQWQDAPNAGFAPAGVETWLPVSDDYAQGINIAGQQSDPESMLSFFRQIAQVRQGNVALRRGEMTLQPDTGDVLAFWRRTPEQSYLVALNMSAHVSELALEAAIARRIYTNHPGSQWDGETAALNLQPYEIWVGESS